MDVTELHDWVAEIRGIDCRRPLGPDDLAALATASARYPLLVMRDQDLTPDGSTGSAGAKGIWSCGTTGA